jgi:hypothetical protein
LRTNWLKKKWMVRLITLLFTSRKTDCSRMSWFQRATFMESTWPNQLIYWDSLCFSWENLVRPVSNVTLMVKYLVYHIFSLKMEASTVGLWSLNVPLTLPRYHCCSPIRKQSFGAASFNGLHCDFSRPGRPRIHGWLCNT